MVELYEYDAYFSINGIPADRREKIVRLFKDSGVAVDITDQYLEFQFKGRDSNRRVVRALQAAASLLQSAEGEMVCEYYDEDRGEGDPLFEFYQIQDGRLYRQLGKIIRSPRELCGM